MELFKEIVIWLGALFLGWLTYSNYKSIALKGEIKEKDEEIIKQTVKVEQAKEEVKKTGASYEEAKSSFYSRFGKYLKPK